MIYANFKIETDESLMELCSHGTADYPFRYYLEDVYAFALHRVDWHWHPELEFVYLRSGQMDCRVGEAHFSLSEGMGLFVNQQVIHSFQTEAPTVTPNILFPLTLLFPEESLLYRKYALPLALSGPEYFIFSPEVPWQAQVLQILQEIFALQEGPQEDELSTFCLLSRLWQILCTHIASVQPPQPAFIRSKARLQMLMRYLQDHSAESISLEQLAQLADISKSSVLNLFRKYLHTSPIQYLLDLRLRQAAQLLSATDTSACSIAASVGFENMGYFCRKFKQTFGVTPGAYRKQRQEGNL